MDAVVSLGGATTFKSATRGATRVLHDISRTAATQVATSAIVLFVIEVLWMAPRFAALRQWVKVKPSEGNGLTPALHEPATLCIARSPRHPQDFYDEQNYC